MEEFTALNGVPTHEVTNVESRSISSHKSMGLVYRLTHDKEYKDKFIKTACLALAFIVQGWVRGQQGPTLIDLQLITGVDLKKGAMFFTASNTGYLVGSLITGILYDKLNKLLLLFISVLGLGLSAITIPWCSLYGVMIAMHFICFLFRGSLDTGGNAYCLALWKTEGRPYMQTIHFFFAIGSILSPLVAVPFLAPRTPVFHQSLNVSNINDSNYAIIVNENISYVNATQNPVEFVNGESKVYYAFIVTGILGFLASIPFLYFYMTSPSDKRGQLMSKLGKDEKRKRDKSRYLSKIFLVALVSLIYFTCVGLDESFFAFLAVFCVKHMNWSKSAGSYATSTFSGSYATGRLIGIVIIRWIRPAKILFIFFVIIVLALAGIIFSAKSKSEIPFLICVAFCGLGMSIIFPTVFSWTEEELFPVSGKTASAFLVSSAIGGMSNPVFLGYLVEELSTMWYPYVLFLESLVLSGLFVTVFTVSKKCVGKRFRSHCDKEFQINQNGTIGETFLSKSANENNNTETADMLL